MAGARSWKSDDGDGDASQQQQQGWREARRGGDASSGCPDTMCGCMQSGPASEESRMHLHRSIMYIDLWHTGVRSVPEPDGYSMHRVKEPTGKLLHVHVVVYRASTMDDIHVPGPEVQ